MSQLTYESKFPLTSRLADELTLYFISCSISPFHSHALFDKNNVILYLTLRVSMIYTIGHGNKVIETFLDELKAYDIKYLIDVRSKPFSKWFPHFNKDNLSNCLNTVNIRYVNMGNQLGGLPKDRELYDDGKVIYSKVSTSAPFKEGIQRIVTASNKKLNIAMMCSETEPGECHRSKLIGEELAKLSIPVTHIKTINNIVTQKELNYEMTKGYGLNDLFGPVELTSNKRY